MPCYDSRCNYSDRDYTTPENLKQLIEYYNCALCAIASELKRRDILIPVFHRASENGVIDLIGWNDMKVMTM